MVCYSCRNSVINPFLLFEGDVTMFGRGARLTALSSLAAANLYVVSSSSTANSENINTLTNVNISTCAKTDKGIKHQ